MAETPREEGEGKLPDEPVCKFSFGFWNRHFVRLVEVLFTRPRRLISGGIFRIEVGSSYVGMVVGAECLHGAGMELIFWENMSIYFEFLARRSVFVVHFLIHISLSFAMQTPSRIMENLFCQVEMNMRLCTLTNY